MTANRHPIVSKCTECGASAPVHSTTVRVYVQRRQDNYRYRFCASCLEGIRFLLADRALKHTRGRYWEPEDDLVVQAMRHVG